MKKVDLQVQRCTWKGSIKLLILVKLAICLTLIFSIKSWASFGQEKVSISLKNVTIESAFKAIEEVSMYNFIYQNDILPQSKYLSIYADKANLSDVMDKILSGTSLNYRLLGRDLVIISNNTTPPEEVTGKITDGSGAPLMGVSITEKGTENGVVSAQDGTFSIRVSSLNAVLVISMVGYETKEVLINGNSDLLVSLTSGENNLDEVVVVGYGTVRRKDLSGSISSVQGEEIAARKTTQLSTALQGAVPGLMITRDNNAPGATASMRVRGITTIGDSNPLVIIDGVPGDINQVNANDVESISVLKDAASASIYGARAAAGVILVTTKRARVDELTMGYNFEYGWERPTQQPRNVNIQRFLEMTNELRYNDNNAGGWYQAYSEDQVKNWVTNNATDPNKYPITDWENLILKKSAPRQTHAITLSGGTKIVKSKASFTYDKVDGLYSDRFYERFMLRANNDFSFNRFLNATLDFNFKRSQSHQPVFNPIERMRIAAPVFAAVWKDGRVAEGKSGSNPYGQMLLGGKSDAWYNQLGAKASLNVTPITGLKFSAIVAPIYNFDKAKSFRLKAPYYLADDPNVIGGYFEGLTTTKLDETRNDNFNVTTQFLGSYLKSFGAHNINLMAGNEYFYAFGEGLRASRDQYELTNYPYLDIGPLTLRDNGGNAYETAYKSWFGRAIYSYANKYILQGNIRYDASSRFAKEYRWGAFPSFSAGWVISEESFMKGINQDWLSYLKLRGSWGTLGNERIGNYPYQAVINFSNALFYKGDQVVSELTASQWQYVIRNISWETTASTNFGLDAYMFANRLKFTADYYNKVTKDMLLALEIPDYVGYDNPEKNTGHMFTKGYELELVYGDQAGDLKYSIGVNFSDFISKMGDLGGTEFLGSQIKKEGSEFNEWYGYLSDGLFLTQEDLNNSAKLNSNIKVGDVKFRDVSGPDGVPDGKISSDYDRVLLGGSLPRYMFGGNIRLAYKDLDFSLAFQGVGKQLVSMTSPMIEPLRENWGNIPLILDGNYWSSKQTDAQNAAMKYPRLTRSNIGSNMTTSDFWLFDGGYARLKNLTLGYSLPQSVSSKIKARSLRIYVSGNDLLCWSKFPQGWDPEMATGSYPITTSFLFGVNVNF